MAKSILLKTAVYRSKEKNGKVTIYFLKNGKYRPLVCELTKEQAEFFIKTLGILNYSFNAIGR